MGDISDWLMDLSMDAESIEEYEQFEDYDVLDVLECKNCGSTNVQWAQDEAGKWHLYDSRTCELHECNFDKLLEAT